MLTTNIVTPTETKTTSNICAETSQQAVSLHPDFGMLAQDEHYSDELSSLNESSVDCSLYLADNDPPVWVVLSRELEVSV